MSPTAASKPPWSSQEKATMQSGRYGAVMLSSVSGNLIWVQQAVNVRDDSEQRHFDAWIAAGPNVDQGKGQRRGEERHSEERRYCLSTTQLRSRPAERVSDTHEQKGRAEEEEPGVIGFTVREGIFFQ